MYVLVCGCTKYRECESAKYLRQEFFDILEGMKFYHKKGHRAELEKAQQMYREHRSHLGPVVKLK